MLTYTYEHQDINKLHSKDYREGGEYIHTYHSRFIPGGAAEVSQIFLRNTHVLPKLVSYEEHCRHDRWLSHRRLIAVYLRCKCY
jgi:hypothetical protein